MRRLLIILLCLLATAPVLAVVGHDFYLTVYNVQPPVKRQFYPSDMGWLWVMYAPDTYDWVRTQASPQIWNDYIDPTLTQKSIMVSAYATAGLYGILFLMKIFGLPPFKNAGIFGITLPKKQKNIDQHKFSKKPSKKARGIKGRSAGR